MRLLCQQIFREPIFIWTTTDGGTRRHGHSAKRMATIDSSAISANDYRWLLIAGFYVSTFLSGIIQAASHNALVYYLSALLMACSATGWCVADARRRGKQLLPVVQLIALLFWFVAVPVYLLASRGWRGLGWIVLNAIGLYASTFAAYFATHYLAYGPESFGP
jgi:hypothetical protein